jgi:hypothetical protein
MNYYILRLSNDREEYGLYIGTKIVGRGSLDYCLEKRADLQSA